MGPVSPADLLFTSPLSRSRVEVEPRADLVEARWLFPHEYDIAG